MFPIDLILCESASLSIQKWIMWGIIVVPGGSSGSGSAREKKSQHAYNVCGLTEQLTVPVEHRICCTGFYNIGFIVNKKYKWKKILIYINKLFSLWSTLFVSVCPAAPRAVAQIYIWKGTSRTRRFKTDNSVGSLKAPQSTVTRCLLVLIPDAWLSC